jgi:hypothetical protein
MSHDMEKLLVLADEFVSQAEGVLTKTAEKKKKLDPKAKVRNRGTVCVPAESAKDKKDHFPINNIDQARNALARVNQYSKAPSWYSGSLQSLINTVVRKVKSKYPSIETSKESSKPGGKKKS